jgi:hypothetical protein
VGGARVPRHHARFEGLSLSDYASLLLFIWRFAWGLYERAHIIRYFLTSVPRQPALVVNEQRLLDFGLLRRGSSVIIPPIFSFVWRIPIVATNESDE